MPALNRIQLIGHLGRDPETKFTPTGKKVTHYSLAVSQRWKVSGENREYTEWMNIEAWGRLGEVCQEYLKKGSLIYLEGRLKTDKYDDNGTTKYFSKVIIQSRPLFYDDRTGDRLMEEVNAIDDEDLEPMEAP